MNILYLTTHLNIGGISSYILTLASGLKKRGHDVTIGSSGGELIDTCLEQGIRCLNIPIKTKSEVSLLKISNSLFRALRFMEERDIDIVHSNTRVTQVLGYFIQRFSHKPHVSTCHGFFKKRFSRMVFPCWGNKVIAISEAVKDHLMSDFRVREEDIAVIHHGIDANKFQIPNPNGSTASFDKLRTSPERSRGTLTIGTEPCALPCSLRANTEPVEVERSRSAKAKIGLRKNLGIDVGPVIGIIARLSDVKGHAYLIAAMKLVLEKIPTTKLLIVGEGRMKQELLDLTRSLEIERQVLFLPSVKDVAEILSIMDLFVMPSLKEGLGLSLMEAMAAGLAVIGSDVGGIRSLVRNGDTGLLVEPADSERLAYAILELLSNQEKAETLGNNARIFIRENFSQESMILETERVYLECLNAKG